MFINVRITQYKIKKNLRYFYEDISATKTARLLGINRNTINRYFLLFRKKIWLSSLSKMEVIAGEIELDESYFGAKKGVTWSWGRRENYCIRVIEEKWKG